jgi:hypothetical protein
MDGVKRAPWFCDEDSSDDDDMKDEPNSDARPEKRPGELSGVK